VRHTAAVLLHILGSIDDLSLAAHQFGGIERLALTAASLGAQAVHQTHDAAIATRLVLVVEQRIDLGHVAAGAVVALLVVAGHIEQTRYVRCRLLPIDPSAIVNHDHS